MGPKLLVLVCLVGAALAGPVSRNRGYAKCSGRCTSPGHSKFSFEVGKEYVYSYEIRNEISLRNSYEKIPALISGKAVIKVLEPCEMALQLEDVRIFHGRQIERGGRLLADLQRNPLYFAFNDGRIEHICPSAEDSHDSINVKRGVLSAIQNSMDNFDTNIVVLETDIMGTCKTEYSVSRNRYGTLEIVKTKDLSTCTDRQWSTSAVMTTQFDPASQWLQNLRIRSDELYQCVQIFKNGLLQEVECSDKSAFKPFAEYKDEAQSEGKISLRFLKERSISDPDPYEFQGRDTLLYAHIPEKFASGESDVLDIIREMCPKIEKTIKEEVPELYQKLVYAVAGLPARTLERVYTSVKSGSACRSPKALDMFLDALPMAGSAGAIELMVKLIQSNVVTGVHADFWLTTLAFVPHPSERAVAAVLPLIREPDVRRQALLGISSMIYRFCSNRTDCDRNTVVNQAIDALHKHLGYKCRISGTEDEEKVIEVLKAFGNLGYHGRALETILDCATTDSNPLHVKVAALQAFRRGGCDDAKTQLMKIYEDSREDTEVRINAYLAVMKCPTRDTIQKIKDVLEREDDEEVAVFMWTHLTNLQKTSAPLKQDIRELVENEDFQMKFTSGILNSRNIDLSVYSDHMKLGAEFESNFIRTPESPIPRSLMANFSADMFGYNINFLECGMRLDGVDDTLDKLFSRGGMFSGTQASDLWSNWKDSRSSWRGSKSRKSDADGSMYCRIFGNELALIHMPKLTDFNIDRAISIMNVLNEMAHDHDLDFARSIMFLDTTVVVPSVTGRAYTLDVKGSGTVGLKLEGKFDVQGLVSNPPSCDIEGHLYPSATVEISAIMGLHSSSKPALKVVATLHTSNEMEAKLEIKNGRILNARFNMPSEKVELFTFRYKAYNVDENGEETPIPGQSTHILDHCTTSFDKVLGVAVCTEFQAPSPLVTTKFPFVPVSGPVDIKFYVKKTDVSVRGYEFALELPDSRDHDLKKFRITFDTPGSRVDRKHSLELRLMNPRSGDKAVAVELYTPYKQLEAAVSYTWRSDLIHCKVEVTVDKAKHYVTSGSLEIRHRGQRKVIVPTIEINWPDMEPATLTGSITYSKGQKEQLTVDLRANKPSSSKPIYVKGTFIKDGRLDSRRNAEWRMSTDWTISLPIIYLGIHGTTEKHGTSLTYDLTVQYQLERRSRQTIKLSSKFQDLSNRETTKITGFKEVQTSQWPQYNWRANINWLKSRSYLENDITIKYGRNFQDQRRYIRFYHSAKLNDRDDGHSNADNKIIIKAPQWNVDFEIRMDSKWDFSENPSIEINSDFSSAEEKKLITGFKFQRMSLKPLKMAVDAKVEYPGREIVYRDSLEERSPKAYTGKTYLQWQKDKHVMMDYDYSMKSFPQQIQHDVEATISSPLMRAPLLQKACLKLSQSSMDVFSQTEFEGRPGYIIDARLAPKGLSEIKFNVPSAEGRFEVDIRPYIKAAKADVRFKDGYRRRLVASSTMSSKPKLAFEAEVAWDADRDPVRKVTFSTELQTESSWTEKKHNWAAKFRYANELHIDAELKLDDKLLYGPHDVTAEVKGKMFRPMYVTAHHEISAGRMKTFVDSKQDNEQNFHLEVTGKYIRESSHLEVGGGLSLTSPAHDIDSMELHLNHRSDFSRPSLSAVTEIRIQPSPTKVYTTNIDYSCHQGSVGNIKLHWTLSTPHPAARPIQATLEAEYTADQIKMETEMSSSSGKSIAWSVVLERSRARYQRASRFITPGDYVMKGTLEVNSRLKYDVNGKLSYDNWQQFDWRMSFKPPTAQPVSGHIRANKDSYSLSYEFGFQKGAVEVFSGKVGIVHKDKGFISSIELHHKKSQMLLIEMSKEVSKAIVYTFKAKGPFTPMYASLQWMNTKSEIQSTLKICHDMPATNCYGYEASYKNDDGNYAGKIHRELRINLLNQKLSRGSVMFMVMNERKLFHSKFLVEIRDKKIGYEVRLDKDSRPPHNLEMTVYLPSREIQVKGECTLSMKEASAHLEVFTDVSRNPRKKFELDASYRNEKISRSRKIEVEIKINYPGSNKPLWAKLYMERNSQSSRPFSVKAELDYAKSTKGKLTAMAYIEASGSDRKNQSVTLMVYREDRRELDIVLKAHIAAEQERLTIGYLIKWNQFGEYKERFFLVDWSVPDEHLNIWYRSPKLTYEALGTYTLTPRDGLKIDFEAIVNGKKGSAKFEVDMHKHCVELSIYKSSGERVKHYEACLGGHCILSLKADSFRSGQKITDLSVVVENTGTKFYSIEADWDPDHVNDVAEYVVHLPQEIYHVVKKDIPMDLWQQIFDEFETVHKAVVYPVFHAAKQEIHKIWYEIEEDFDSMMRIIAKIYRKSEILSSFIDEIITALKKAWAEIKYEISQLIKDFDVDALMKTLKRIWKCIIQKWEDYWNRYCSYNSVCYKVKYAYRQKWLKGAIQVLWDELLPIPDAYYKIALTIKNSAFHSWSKYFATIRVPLFKAKDKLGDLVDCVKKVTDYIFSIDILDDIVTCVKSWTEDWYTDIKKAVQKIWYDMKEKLSHNEDVRAVIDVAKEMKDEVWKEITKLRPRDVYEKLHDCFYRFVSSFFDADTARVMEYDPVNGHLKFEVLSPEDLPAFRVAWKGYKKLKSFTNDIE